jgi:uncharacterized membrane protein
MAALDVPWVLLNARFGLYKGRAAPGRAWLVAPVWLAMLVAEAWLLAYVARPQKTYRAAALVGALAGLTVYVVYNGTTLVTDRAWTGAQALLDTCWGAVMFAVAAVLVHLAASPAPAYDPARSHPASIPAAKAK